MMNKSLLIKASFLLGILLAFSLLFCFLNQSYAIEVTLTWESNTEPDLAGYYIYYKTNSFQDYRGEDRIKVCFCHTQGIYSGADAVKEIYRDANKAVICNLIIQPELGVEVYFFRVTAYDASGLESAPSCEVGTNENLEDDNPAANSDIVNENYSIDKSNYEINGCNFFTGPTQNFALWDSNPAIYDYVDYRPCNSITMGCSYCHAFPPVTHSVTAIDCDQCHPTPLFGATPRSEYHINGVPDLLGYDTTANSPTYLIFSSNCYTINNDPFLSLCFNTNDFFGLPVSMSGIHNTYAPGTAFFLAFGTKNFLNPFLPKPFADNIQFQNLVNGNNSFSSSSSSGYQFIFGLWPEYYFRP